MTLQRDQEPRITLEGARANFAADHQNSDWKAFGECRADGIDYEIFGAEFLGDEQEREKQIALAKAICATCPLTDVCLDYAIYNGETTWIWGGQTGPERAVIIQTLRGNTD